MNHVIRSTHKLMVAVAIIAATCGASLTASATTSGTADYILSPFFTTPAHGNGVYECYYLYNFWQPTVFGEIPAHMGCGPITSLNPYATNLNTGEFYSVQNMPSTQNAMLPTTDPYGKLYSYLLLTTDSTANCPTIAVSFPSECGGECQSCGGTSGTACKCDDNCSLRGDCCLNVADICTTPACNTVWYPDADHDGFGDKYSYGQKACDCPFGTCSLDNTDCHDGIAALNPMTRWFQDDDHDGDGYSAYTISCDPPQGYIQNANGTLSVGPGWVHTSSTDCNDGNAQINSLPRYQVCADSDHDTFGNPATKQTVSSCFIGSRNGNTTTWPQSAPNGYTYNCISPLNDCDDRNTAIHGPTWYPDADGDGFGDASRNGAITAACTPPTGSHGAPLPVAYVQNANDCNDADININPNTVWYADNDNDGFGSGAIVGTGCQKLGQWSYKASDCNDHDALINPTTKWYKDLDEDSFGGSLYATVCAPSAADQAQYHLTTTSGDCDDHDIKTKDGTKTYWHVDLDGDGDGWQNTPAISMITGCTPPTIVTLSDCQSAGHLDEECNTFDGTAKWSRNASDCDPISADVTGSTSFYLDVDGDKYGDSAVPMNCHYAAPNQSTINTTFLLSLCNEYFTVPSKKIYSNHFSPSMVAEYCQSALDAKQLTAVPNGGDCQPLIEAYNPGVTWYPDIDGDKSGYNQSAGYSCRPPINGNDVKDDFSCYMAGYKTPECQTELLTECTHTIVCKQDNTCSTITDYYCQTYASNKLSWVTNNNDCEESDLSTLGGWTSDNDGDGYGNPADVSCKADQVHTVPYLKTDCDDTDPLILGPTHYYIDRDNDGFGDPQTSLALCAPDTTEQHDPDNHYVTNASDFKDFWFASSIEENIYQTLSSNAGFYLKNGARLTPCLIINSQITCMDNSIPAEYNYNKLFLTNTVPIIDNIGSISISQDPAIKARALSGVLRLTHSFGDSLLVSDAETHTTYFLSGSAPYTIFDATNHFPDIYSCDIPYGKTSQADYKSINLPHSIGSILSANAKDFVDLSSCLDGSVFTYTPDGQPSASYGYIRGGRWAPVTLTSVPTTVFAITIPVNLLTKIPIAIDTDNDFLYDDEETALGLSPFNIDTDGDLVSDFLEVMGTNLKLNAAELQLITPIVTSKSMIVDQFPFPPDEVAIFNEAKIQAKQLLPLLDAYVNELVSAEFIDSTYSMEAGIDDARLGRLYMLSSTTNLVSENVFGFFTGDTKTIYVDGSLCQYNSTFQYNVVHSLSLGCITNTLLHEALHGRLIIDTLGDFDKLSIIEHEYIHQLLEGALYGIPDYFPGLTN